jgi:predicted Zn-dependent protease
MRYKHTVFDDSVNVTRVHPLKEFFGYLVAIILLIGALFFASAWAVNLLVPHVDSKRENWIWEHLLQDQFTPAEEDSALVSSAQSQLQSLLNSIPKQGLPQSEYQVIVIPSSEINAMALPSGKIVVFSGLLDVLKTENAVVFMLGHELGHFAHRDHLRGMGRSLIMAMILAPILSDDSANAVMRYVQQGYDSYFSREQEIAADSYGLHTLRHHYGHAGGATELFEILREKEAESGLSEYLSTHPISVHRIEHLQQMIAQEKIPVYTPKPKKIKEIQKNGL